MFRKQIKSVDYWVEWLKFSKYVVCFTVQSKQNTAPEAFNSPYSQECFAWKQNTKNTE